jgi:hypothetical protein
LSCLSPAEGYAARPETSLRDPRSTQHTAFIPER